MIANYAMGLDDASRAAYEQCRTSIGDDLGLDVTSATDDLAAAIDAGAPVADLIDDLTAPSYGVHKVGVATPPGAALLQVG